MADRQVVREWPVTKISSFSKEDPLAAIRLLADKALQLVKFRLEIQIRVIQPLLHPFQISAIFKREEAL